jgi:glycosyltransferase involved in cell wall biosynthesis
LGTSVDFGGIEKVLLMLCRQMDADVELIPVIFTKTDTRDSTFFKELRALGLSPRVLPVDQSRLKYLSPLQHVVDTVAVLRSERFDLIHSHGYRADLIALPLSRYFRVPAVSTCHGFTPNNRRLALYTKLNEIALRYFDCVVAVSVKMRDELIGSGVNPASIEVIPNAVEPVCQTERAIARRDIRTQLGLAEREFVLGYVGRLSEEKGLEHLLGALALRPPIRQPWRLVVVGDGPCLRDLEKQTSQAGLVDHVTFVGFQSRASPWFSAMDVFVLPSLTEGTPMALLEAMAHRVPVIASEVGGVPAVIADRVSGLLVPPADRRALSLALAELASNHELRRRFSDVAYVTVCERYNVQTWIASVKRVYERVLQGS